MGVDRSFIDKFNEVSVRKSKKQCICKVCDRTIEKEEDIVYFKSFRLKGQPFHICLSCWKKVNEMVEEYMKGE